ncbi:MAG: hypothetical protein ACLPKB_18810 [Xanthobacteraceae bacterium]
MAASPSGLSGAAPTHARPWKNLDRRARRRRDDFPGSDRELRAAITADYPKRGLALCQMQDLSERFDEAMRYIAA